MLDFIPMKPVSATDYYEVRKMGSISSSAMASLADCYLPIIGALSLATYECLAMDTTVLNEHAMPTIGDVISKLKMSLGQFEAAMRPLEAIGLARSFLKKTEEGSFFVFCLYPPLSPEAFLGDFLYRNVLERYIGTKSVELLDKKYPRLETPTWLEECSESFRDYFHPEGASAAFKVDLNQKPTGLNLGFIKNEFDKRLFDLGISVTKLTGDDYDRIAKIGSLYGYSSSTLADIAFDCYENGILNLEDFEEACQYISKFTYTKHEQDKGRKSRVTVDSKIAANIRLMDETQPDKFLCMLQNGHSPAAPDLRLVHRLGVEIGLPDPCINALVKYCIDSNQGRLIPAYCEKLGAAMVRVGCRTSRDAVDFLLAGARKKNTQNQPIQTPSESKPATEPQQTQKDDEDEEIDNKPLSEFLAGL